MLRRMDNLHRGLLRLGVSLWLLWFVYWTCAYIIRTPPAENRAAPLPLSTYLALAPLLIAAATTAIRWILAGFRSDA